MRQSYTPAQFTRGLREMRNETEEQIVTLLTQRLVSAEASDDPRRLLTDIIEDIKHGEHRP